MFQAPSFSIATHLTEATQLAINTAKYINRPPGLSVQGVLDPGYQRKRVEQNQDFCYFVVVSRIDHEEKFLSVYRNVIDD